MTTRTESAVDLAGGGWQNARSLPSPPGCGIQGVLMRRTIVLACAVFTIAAGPTSKPTTAPANLSADSGDEGLAPRPVVRSSIPLDRHSTDGSLLPDVTAKYWWCDAKLGVIGPILGALPEGVGAGGRVFSLDSDNGTAKRAREYLGNCGVDAAEYDWVVTGVGSSAFALLKLTDGRVSGVCLMNQNDAAAWKNVRAAISRSGVTQGDGFRVGQINFHIRTSGQWTKTSSVTEGPFGHQTVTYTNTQCPAALMIEVDRFDFKMATNCQSKENYASVLAGKVKVGMSMIEAYFAMRNYDLKRVRDPKTPSTETWVWTGQVVKTIGMHTYRDDYGTTVVSDQSITDHQVARAVLDRGYVTSFDWAIN